MNTKGLGPSQIAILKEMKARADCYSKIGYMAGDSLLFRDKRWQQIMNTLLARGIVQRGVNGHYWLTEKPKRYYIVPVAAGFETRAAAEAAMAACDRSKWKEVIAEAESE